MLAIQRCHRFALAATVLAAALVFHAGTAVAGLKATAPADVELSGAWKVNLQLSEDPEEALEEHRQQARDRVNGVRSVVGPAVGGIMGGVVGAVLGGVANNNPEQRERALLQVLMQTWDQFEIAQQSRALTRKRAGGETETCQGRDKQAVKLSTGDTAERRCGWNGKAFVVELKIPNAFTRTDRYELAEDSNQLEVTTDIKSAKGPRSSFQFTRVYDPVPLSELAREAPGGNANP